jgi:alpha-L-rhamnosidase
MSPVSDTPYDLAVDSGGDQFVVSGPHPRLSWKLPQRHDGGYDLEAEIDGVALDIVSSPSDEHLFVEWPWRPLRSRERVAWRVRLHGESDWSAWHHFEAGLFEADWTARWISPVEEPGHAAGERPAYTLREEFNVDHAVASARLYSTALGVYEAFVNGERAGTAELAPGTSSYEHTLYAQATDVGGALRPGANTIEILLSDGWYRGRFGAFRRPVDWGDTLAARLELHVTGTDGSTLVVGTDHAWTSSRSQITRADLMEGQTTDFQVPVGLEQPVLVDQVVAPAVDWSPAPPVRKVETREPRSVVRLASGAWIVDFGQNTSGWIRLTDLGPAGTRTVIDYGEHLDPDGDLNLTHLDGIEPGKPPVRFVQRDEVVSAGAADEFEPRHTIHGFQYARIDRGGVPLDAAAVTMQVVHTDLHPTGTFACSDSDLTRLFDVARWSFRGNAVDIPTDCPTRERLGWTGDFQVFAPTATRLYDVHGFARKWLRSVRDDQLDDGRIANYSPDGRRIKHHLGDLFAILTGSAGWGDAIVLVPWELYRAYGSRLALVENWDAMVRWVEWALTAARTQRHPTRVARSEVPLPHEQYVWDGSFHWGEWSEPKQRGADGSLVDPVQADPGGWFAADKGEVGTAFLYRSTVTLGRIADVLGRAGEAAAYAATAAHIREAWQAEFLNDDGTTTVDTQASYVRALSFGLVPDGLRAAAAARLVGLIGEAGNHLTTGFLATPDLLPALADAGHADVAYDLLFQRTSPSWLGMLDRGATTIWEEWDGIEADGSAHASLNHYSKGAVVRFMHSHTLGLRQAEDSVAWESFVVAPVPHPAITWASGSLETPQGTIKVAWSIDGDDLGLTVEVPAGAAAQIVFPDGHTEAVGTGTFDRRRPWRGPAWGLVGGTATR